MKLSVVASTRTEGREGGEGKKDREGGKEKCML